MDDGRAGRAPRRDAPLVAHEVLDEWVHLVHLCPPWRDMYPDDRTGELRRVLDELLQPHDGDVARRHEARLWSAAHSHGRFRRGQGCSAQILTEELDLLDEAICCVLLRHGISRAAVAAWFDALGRDLRSVARAVYGGFVD